MHAIDTLQPINADSGSLNCIVETPHGNRNKFKWDPEAGLFVLDRILPDGCAFPFDYGFLPGTLGDDGDPLDVIVMMDAPAAIGVLVPSRPIGIIEAEQTENAQTSRNDRLFAVAETSRTYRELRTLENVSASQLYEFEQFFVTYHRLLGNVFRLLGRRGPEYAPAMISLGIDKHLAAHTRRRAQSQRRDRSGLLIQRGRPEPRRKQRTI